MNGREFPSLRPLSPGPRSPLRGGPWAPGAAAGLGGTAELFRALPWTRKPQSFQKPFLVGTSRGTFATRPFVRTAQGGAVPAGQRGDVLGSPPPPSPPRAHASRPWHGGTVRVPWPTPEALRGRRLPVCACPPAAHSGSPAPSP